MIVAGHDRDVAVRYACVQPAIGYVSEHPTGIAVVVAAAVVGAVVPVIRGGVAPGPIGIPKASVEAHREPWTVRPIRIVVRPPRVDPPRVEPTCAGPEGPSGHDTWRRVADRTSTVSAPATPGWLRARLGDRPCGTRRHANEGGNDFFVIHDQAHEPGRGGH